MISTGLMIMIMEMIIIKTNIFSQSHVWLSKKDGAVDGNPSTHFISSVCFADLVLGGLCP